MKAIAEYAEELVKLREEKVPMSRKLMRPIDSQPNSRSKSPAAFTDNHTENRKRTSRRANPTYEKSNSRYEENSQSPISDENIDNTRTFHDENSVRANELSNRMFEMFRSIEVTDEDTAELAERRLSTTKIAVAGISIPELTANNIGI